jgi:hypothetical protein
MYGEMRGIVGSTLPPAPALELDTIAGQLEDVAVELP